ncbi:hypothetical protein Q7P37_007959 [Cladosporium fusiforme]
MAAVSDLLESPLTLPLGILLLVLYAGARAFYSWRALRQFKGPLLAKFTSLWLFWQSACSRLSAAEFDALQQYGSPCRIGPRLLLTDDADLVRHMNAAGSKWRRSGWYDGLRFDPRQDSVFSTRDERFHADLKSKEIGGYNGRDIDTLEPDIDGCVEELIHLIRTNYSHNVVDMSSIARYFTLDVLSTVAFGRPFGFMAANADLWDYSKLTSGSMQILEMVANHSTVRWVFQSRLLQFLAAPRPSDAKGMGPVLGFARRAVAERFGPDAKVKNDMLGHFINRGLDQERCEVEANLQIVAGSDSTTTVLRSALWLLAGTPVAYTKVRQEIDTASDDGRLSHPVVTYREAQTLPYLTACLWEALRLFPPLFGLKTKLAPIGGDTVKGIYYPEGTEVGICDDAMCRSTAIFGDDAHLFRPDRWMQADPETRVKYQQTVNAVFGSGRFICLGRHIALMELHKALVELIRNFDWQIADPFRGVNTISHAVHLQTNMNMLAIPRQ